MTADEFSTIARKVGTTLPIDGTVFPKSGGTFSGRGTLTREEGHFKLSITFPIGAAPPEARGGIYTQDDMWRFEGTLSGHLLVTADALDPWGGMSTYNGIPTHTFETQSLDIRNPACDPAALLNFYAGRSPSKEAPVSSKEPAPDNPEPSTWYIHATIINYPLLSTNAKTTFTEDNAFTGLTPRVTRDTLTGQAQDYKFGLIHRDENLEVHLHLEPVRNFHGKRGRSRRQAKASQWKPAKVGASRS